MIYIIWMIVGGSLCWSLGRGGGEGRLVWCGRGGWPVGVGVWECRGQGGQGADGELRDALGLERVL